MICYRETETWDSLLYFTHNRKRPWMLSSTTTVCDFYSPGTIWFYSTRYRTEKTSRIASPPFFFSLPIIKEKFLARGNGTRGRKYASGRLTNLVKQKGLPVEPPLISFRMIQYPRVQLSEQGGGWGEGKARGKTCYPSTACNPLSLTRPIPCMHESVGLLWPRRGTLLEESPGHWRVCFFGFSGCYFLPSRVCVCAYFHGLFWKNSLVFFSFVLFYLFVSFIPPLASLFFREICGCVYFRVGLFWRNRSFFLFVYLFFISFFVCFFFLSCVCGCIYSVCGTLFVLSYYSFFCAFICVHFRDVFVNVRVFVFLLFSVFFFICMWSSYVGLSLL